MASSLDNLASSRFRESIGHYVLNLRLLVELLHVDNVDQRHLVTADQNSLTDFISTNFRTAALVKSSAG